MAAPDRTRILFLCTGNSCRSQMAEGFARTLYPDRLQAWSAGVDPHGLNPLAVRAMSEAGVDISGQQSRSIQDVLDAAGGFDVVVTVCDNAREACPVFPGAARLMHAGFDDPPRLAADATSDDEAMVHYRRVRDEIKTFIERLPELISAKQAEGSQS